MTQDPANPRKHGRSHLISAETLATAADEATASGGGRRRRVPSHDEGHGMRVHGIYIATVSLAVLAALLVVALILGATMMM